MHAFEVHAFVRVQRLVMTIYVSRRATPRIKLFSVRTNSVSVKKMTKLVSKSKALVFRQWFDNFMTKF